jgi:prevent-host-death family protein
MSISATELRANLYRLLDRVVKGGETIEINRGGKILKIVLSSPPDKLDHLVKRKGYLKGDAGDIVHMDWSDQWNP